MVSMGNDQRELKAGEQGSCLEPPNTRLEVFAEAQRGEKQWELWISNLLWALSPDGASRNLFVSQIAGLVGRQRGRALAAQMPEGRLPMQSRMFDILTPFPHG